MTVAEIAQHCFLNSPNWRNQNPLVIPDESTRRTAATPHGKAHSWMLGYDHRPDENHQESPTSSLNTNNSPFLNSGVGLDLDSELMVHKSIG